MTDNPKRFIKLTAVGVAHFRTPAEIRDEEAFRKKIISALDAESIAKRRKDEKHRAL